MPPTYYLVYLMRTYGVEAPLDSAIAMAPKIDVILTRGRARAGLLAQDLIALGLRPAEVMNLTMCLCIPQFRGVAEAMVWLYVSERTTLAHNVVRRHLMTRLPIEMESAASYLSSYDGVVGKRWQELGTALDGVALHPVSADRIVASANEAFRCRRQWTAQDGTADLARSTGSPGSNPREVAYGSRHGR